MKYCHLRPTARGCLRTLKLGAYDKSVLLDSLSGNTVPAVETRIRGLENGTLSIGSFLCILGPTSRHLELAYCTNTNLEGHTLFFSVFPVV